MGIFRSTKLKIQRQSIFEWLPQIFFGRYHKGRAFPLVSFLPYFSSKQKKRIPLPPKARSPNTGNIPDVGFMISDLVHRVIF
jgi:hypothetical protein